LRVLIGLPENIAPSKNFFRDDNYIIFASSGKIDSYLKSNPGNAGFIGSINIVALTADNHTEEINEILENLAKRGVMLAMVEGGGRTAGSFFDAGEMDQFMYVITPKVIGNGIAAMCGKGIERMAQALPVRDVSAVMIRDEVLYNGYSEQYNFEMM
jgi:riboflavin biosynthesis pyrimidine reductase